jgi:hypothetical protein
VSNLKLGDDIQYFASRSNTNFKEIIMLQQKKMRTWFPIALILAPSLLLTGCGGSSSGGSSSAAAQANLEFGLKSFNFNWVDINDATYYKLLERPDQISGYVQVGDDIPTGVEEYTHTVALYNRVNASYILQSCNDDGCTDSDAIYVTGTLDDAIGYVKASNTRSGDQFGYSVALSGDGTTLAVGAYEEDSGGANCVSESDISNSGAVYVFRNQNGNWSQESCIKSDDIDAVDQFGFSVALNNDGTALAVGANREGNVYVFRHNDGSATPWSQEASLRSDNYGASDYFGEAVALSDDGSTLAIGAIREDSDTTGINSASNNDAASAGAAYVFRYSNDAWTQQAYIKASNAGAADEFGISMALSSDGNILAVGAAGEESSTNGVNSTPNDSAAGSNPGRGPGAVYVFRYDSNAWSEEAYVKASNPSKGDSFGKAIALSADGSALAVGANSESGSATYSGAAYVFRYASNNWTQEAYIKANSPTTTAYLGTSVALNANGTVLAVGASGETSSSTGVGSTPNTSADRAGAAFIFNYDDNAWTEGAYIKASNAGSADRFGASVALSNDSDVLAVGAYGEDSLAIGVNGTQNDNATDSGSVYLY